MVLEAGTEMQHTHTHTPTQSGWGAAGCLSRVAGSELCSGAVYLELSLQDSDVIVFCYQLRWLFLQC